MKAETFQIPTPCIATQETTPGDALRFTTRDRSWNRALWQLSRIALKEFGDRFASGWVIACVVVWLAVIGLTSFLGLLQVGRIGVQGYERTVISLLNLVQYLVPLLGLLLSHDLLVGEREDQTLRLLVASGVNRSRLLMGKFLGGCLTITMPLLLGFVIAGAAIGFTAKDATVAPFLRLAVSSVLLGIVFLGIGVAISAFSRTRIQALVMVLVAWGVAVFVFDLVALGMVFSTKVPSASREIDLVCDATHVNAMADLHSGYDNLPDRVPPPAAPHAGNLNWVMINPVDLFRAVNLSKQLETSVPAATIALTTSLWLAAVLGVSLWKLKRIDL